MTDSTTYDLGSDQNFVRREQLNNNIDGLRDQVCDWLRANGIRPGDIPASARVTWIDGQLTTDVFLLSRDGRVQFDPLRENEVAIETRTFPATEPPPLVAKWLLPRCPTCGR